MSERIDNYPFYWEFLLACGGGAEEGGGAHARKNQFQSHGLWARIFIILRSQRINSKEPIPPGCVAWARIFKRLWSPGIDSKEWIPPVYVAWRPGTITLIPLGS